MDVQHYPRARDTIVHFVSTDGLIATGELVNTVVKAIQYSNSSHDPELNVTLSYVFNDGLGTGNSIASSNIIVNITAVNTAPVNNIPVAQALNQNATLTFSTANGNNINVTDLDIRNGSETVTLTVNHGTLKLSTVDGLTVDGDGTSTITVQGTLTNLNQALNGLIYAPNVNYFGTDSLKIVTNDNGNTGTGGALSVTNSIGINVNQLNVTLSGSTLVANSNVIANFTSVNGQLQISFVNNGTIATSLLVKEVIEAIKYNNSSNDPPANVNLLYVFNDGLGLGSNSIAASNIVVNIAPVNNVPVNTVPNAQIINENSVLTFSSGLNRAISISDVDAEGGNETITVTATHGTLTLNGIAGLTVTGNTTGTIVATGTVSNINTALNGLVYTPNANYYGSDNITLTTSDNGNVGSGGAMTTAPSSIAITINQVNVPNIQPSINNLGTMSSNTYVEAGSAVLINNNSLIYWKTIDGIVIKTRFIA